MLGKQGAEICKDLGERGKKIGVMVGEEIGRRANTSMAAKIQTKLLLALLIDMHRLASAFN